MRIEEKEAETDRRQEMNIDAAVGELKTKIYGTVQTGHRLIRKSCACDKAIFKKGVILTICICICFI